MHNNACPAQHKSLAILLITYKSNTSSRNDSSTRGGIMKILKPQPTNNVRAHSFACRNVNAWNSLPEHVRCATSVGVFRKLLKTCKLQPFLIVHV